MIENIPAELRALPQWVAAGPDKKPINPRTGRSADPSNPASGGTFAEAVQAGMKHIGFILGESDPFAVVDLDDPFERIIKGERSRILEGDEDYPEAFQRAQRHTIIFNAFNTYAELSQSGRGVHLVMRGAIPCGVRRDKVEIYSKERYIIFTGNVLKQLPITDCQGLLDAMFSQMGKMTDESGELIEEEPVKEDSEIWRMATNATNAEKFIKLCEGEFESMGYPSQSEADFALISMLAFYTRSNEQVRRMFRQTALGQRGKATRNDVYINRSLKRIRLRETPNVDFSKLPQIEAPSEPDPEPEFSKLPPPPVAPYSFPPGLVGEIARYILSSSIRPVPEVALVASLALCAGIAGRSYNISGTGLNQYLILLAKTGRGKEGAATGIDNIISALRQTIPVADDFIGPAAFASGQALVKVLDSKPCFVSILGEFGLTLQQICDREAAAPLVMLRRVLLDIYSKSGWSKMLRASVYSDSDKNTKVVQAPNVTLLGESTHERFFDGLDASHIAEGLIPRFSIIEYNGIRPPINPNANHPPEADLLERIGNLVAVAVCSAQNHTCCPVSVTPEAKAILDALNIESDERINGATVDAEAELWNRAHLKALKLAALVAVGVNIQAPTVDLEAAKWAVNFVRKEITSIMARFSSGEIGNGEAKQESELLRLFNHFQTLTEDQKSFHRLPEALFEKRVCPFTFFVSYAARLACFRTDRRGPRRALKECLEDLVKREVFEMIPLQQLMTEYKTRSPIYYPGRGWTEKTPGGNR